MHGICAFMHVCPKHPNPQIPKSVCRRHRSVKMGDKEYSAGTGKICVSFGFGVPLFGFYERGVSREARVLDVGKQICLDLVHAVGTWKGEGGVSNVDIRVTSRSTSDRWRIER